MVDLGIVEGLKELAQDILNGAVQLASDLIVGIAKAIGPALIEIAVGIKDAFSEAFKENPVELWFMLSSIIIIIFVWLYAWRTIGKKTVQVAQTATVAA